MIYIGLVWLFCFEFLVLCRKKRIVEFFVDCKCVIILYFDLLGWLMLFRVGICEKLIVMGRVSGKVII